MEQEQTVLERIQRAEKEFQELLKREDLSFAIREELINGQRRSLGIVFVPNPPQVETVSSPPLVSPGGELLNRKIRRLFQWNH